MDRERIREAADKFVWDEGDFVIEERVEPIPEIEEKTYDDFLRRIGVLPKRE